MAILDRITVGNKSIIVVDTDPTISGVAAPLGSLILMDDGSAMYFKSNTGDTNWSENVTAANFGDISSVGTITTGEWNGSVITTTYTEAKVKTVTGTTNRILVSGTATDPIFDISSSYVGQNTITTLGTITTGVWNGTTIANGFISNTLSGKTYEGNTITAGSGTLTLSTFTLTVAGTSTISGTHTGASSGTNTGDQTTITGNAGTASALQTPRTINGVSFNGTANITVTAAANTLTGTTLNATVVTSSLTSVGTITTGVWNGTAIADSFITSALTSKTYNGLTITSTTGTFTLTNGKVLSISNTLSFTGTDSSSIAFGTGGTVTYTSNNLGVFSSTTSAQLASVISDATGTGELVFNNSPVILTPIITGGSHTEITSFGIKSSGTGDFDMTINNNENLTASRNLRFTLNDADRAITLGGNITTAANFITSGANSLTLTTTGSTNVTLPTTGTLVNSAVTTLSSLSSIGIITTGIWNSTVISAPFGGTGQTVYAVGDLLYANSTATLAKLADVATGNALISGGVGVAPSYGKIGLTTHISGTLAIGNGGTGQTTAVAAFNALSPSTTKGDLIVHNGTDDIRVGVGANGTLLLADSTQASGVRWAQSTSTQASPANPTTTTSTIGVMMGLAGSVTPATTGRVMIIISGSMDNTTGDNGAQVQMRTGTGAAPGNGVALTGTTRGGLLKMEVNASLGSTTITTPFCCNTTITGLAIGTPLWIDVGLAAITGGTARLRDISISVIEY